MKHKCSLAFGIITFVCGPLAYGVDDLVMGSDNTNPTRAVVGSDAEVTFRLFNNTASAIDFTLTPQGITSGGNITGPGTPILGGTGPVPQTLHEYSFNANTSGAAGSTITTGLTASEILGTRTATASHDIRLLENRTINFSLSSGDKTTVNGVLDLGRYIGARSLNYYRNNTYSNRETYGYGRSMTLTLSGGAQGHDVATDVAYNPKLLSNFIYNNGRVLTDTTGSGSNIWMSSYYGANQAPQTFNAPDQTTSVNLGFYELGQFSNTYQFGSASNLGTAFSAETGVAGSSVVFGSPVTITGTSLANRLLLASSPSGGAESNQVDMYNLWWLNHRNPTPEALTGRLDSDSTVPGIQSRVMVGSVGSIAAGSETWTIASPGGDNSFARVNFTGTGIVSEGSVSVDTGSGVTLFDGTTSRNITASWTNQSFGTGAGVDIDTATAGRHSTLVNLTPNLSSGEAGGALPGQDLGSLSVGYSFEVVKDRTVSVGNLNRTAFTGQYITLSNEVYGDSGSVTNPTAHFQGGGSASFSATANSVYDSFDVGTGFGSGTRSVSITPEGLAGERAAYSLSYDWSLNRVDAATMHESGSLATPGSEERFISITRTNETGLSASVGTFQWNQTGGAAVGIDAWGNLGDGWSVADAGLGTSNASFNFVFDDTGLNNGTYFGYYRTSASHVGDIIGSYYGDAGTNRFWMEAVVSGREDTTAYQGFRLDNFQATAPPEVSAEVEGKSGAFRILDIVDTSGTRGVSMQVLSSLGSVGSGDSELSFVSGSIKGLDGITFVLESTYDEQEMINLFGSEELAVLLWEKSTGVFVNAVLGNYGDAFDAAIDPLTGEPYDPKLGQRFVGSYEEYLLANSLTLGSPQLGDYGYDPVNNTVWAVIDHNSTFGGGISTIPEPSSILLVFGGCMATLMRRRRN